MRNCFAFLILLSLTLLGCTREQNETTKVTFTLPLASSTLASSGNSAQSGGGNWGQSDPTSLSEIGCYAVFIGGPEADLSNKSCSVGSGTSFKTFKFGAGGGFYPAGSTISLETKPGSGRQFYVLGVKKGSAACGSFDVGTPDSLDSTNYSNPLLLGQASKDLLSGDNAVTINLALTNLTSQKIGDCNFYPNRAPLSKVRFEGPTTYNSDSDEVFKLGKNACSKLYLSLTNADGDGGGFNDKARVVALTKTGANLANFDVYGDSLCSGTPITQATFPAGEDSVPLYFKSPTATAGDASLDVTSVSGFDSSFTTELGIWVNGALATGTSPYFYDYSMNIPAGQCEEIEYALLDGSGFTADPAASPVGVTFVDLAGAAQTPASLTPVTDCASLTTTSTTNTSSGFSFGTFGLRMGATQQKDVKVKLLVPAYTPVFMPVNITNTANSLSLVAPSTNFFVGDCVNLGVSALNSSGATETFAGNDSSGFGVAKRAAGQLYLYSQTGSQSYYDYSSDASCTSGSPGSGPFSFTLQNANQNYSKYVRILNEQTYQVSADAHPYVNGESPEVAINPLWSPYLLGANLLEWLKVENATGGGSMTSWPAETYPALGALATPAIGASSAELIAYSSLSGKKAIVFTNTDQQNFTIPLSSSTTVSVSFMVNVDSSDVGGRLFSINTGSTVHTSIDIAASAASVNFDIDGSGPIPIGYLTDMVDKWSVVTIIMKPLTTTTIDVYLNGSTQMFSNYDTLLSPYTIDKLVFGDDVASGGTSSKAKLTDIIVTNNIPSGSDLTKIYTYYKNRFPTAGLP
jgi:hypothetical protein